MLTIRKTNAILSVVEKTQPKGDDDMSCNYDYRKLRGRIKEKFGTQSEFSKKLGLSEVSVSNKLNNVVDWGQEEMENAISILEIPNTDIHAYFFTHEVKKNSTSK